MVQNEVTSMYEDIQIMMSWKLYWQRGQKHPCTTVSTASPIQYFLILIVANASADMSADQLQTNLSKCSVFVKDSA